LSTVFNHFFAALLTESKKTILSLSPVFLSLWRGLPRDAAA
jgi:hypothetical protein